MRGLNAGFTQVRNNGIEGTTATCASDINGSTNRGRELYNDLAHKTQPRITSLYSNRWDTPMGKAGALFSLA